MTYKQSFPNQYPQICVICKQMTAIGKGHYHKRAIAKSAQYSFDVFHITDCEEKYWAKLKKLESSE